MRRFRFCSVAAVTACAGVAWAGVASAGPPFLTDDPEPVDYQHWEIYGFSTENAVQGDTRGILPGVEVNYGAAPNLQLHVIAPIAFNAQAGDGFQYGLGDIELGTKYRFIEQDKDGWVPDIGIFPLVEAPTGNARLGLGAGHTQIFMPVWLQKDDGDWTTYGGGGYWINPGAGNRNYFFVGWLLQRQVTKQLAIGAEVFHQTAATEPGRDSTGFNIGAIYDFNDHYHLLLSAGEGLRNARTNDQFSYYFGIQNTF